MFSSLASFVATLAIVGVVAPEHVVAQSSAGTALPPSASSLPGCAITCTLSSLPGTACAQYGVSNTTCICTDQQFQLATELQAALAFGAQTCSANGTPINTSVTPSGCAASGSAPSASAPTSPASKVEIGTRSYAAVGLTAIALVGGLRLLF
ncbi:hypothetical protein OIV83_000821 [Microbotryomycetes sp. JL201]|nr:hypothetical protein OIV83_000821 [Microbotryomycetes sp. JL201]